MTHKIRVQYLYTSAFNTTNIGFPEEFEEQFIPRDWQSRLCTSHRFRNKQHCELHEIYKFFKTNRVIDVGNLEEKMRNSGMMDPWEGVGALPDL